MRVSVRARLAVAKACWNRRSSWLPSVPAARARAQASFTWPRICGSPSTSESSPVATRNRWRTASASSWPIQISVQVARAVRMRGEPVARARVRRRRRPRTARCGCRSTASPLRAPAAARAAPPARAGSASAANATRSRKATGAVWWLMPRATRQVNVLWSHARFRVPDARHRSPVQALAISCLRRRPSFYGRAAASAASSAIVPLPGRMLLPRCLLAPAAAAAAPAHDEAWRARCAGARRSPANSRCRPGQLDEAAALVPGRRARLGDDAGLAERATRIALLANDDSPRRRGAEAVAQACAAFAGDAHGRGDAVAAPQRCPRRARELEALLRDPAADDGWRHALAVLGSGAKDPKLSAQAAGRTASTPARFPNQLQAWLAFGGLAQRLDQAALAERIVGEVVKRFPGEPRVALLRASQLREAGKHDEAQQALAGDRGRSQAVDAGTAPVGRGRIRRARRACRGRRRARARAAGRPELCACAPRCWPRPRTRRR